MGLFDRFINKKLQEEKPKPPQDRIRYVKETFDRYSQDITDWRNAIRYAENVYTPFRVNLQRIYNDTVLNAHVASCINKRKDMSLLKDFEFVKNTGEVDEEVTIMMKSKWFYDFMSYSLDALAYGYQLIELGNFNKTGYDKVSIIPRERVSPDRFNVSSNLYSISGESFLDPQYEKWYVYIDTPSNTGNVNCGLGYLNEVVPYEIWSRASMSNWNEYQQLFGMPIRVGKTNATDQLMRQNMADMLENMGTAAWGVFDLNDTIEFIQTSSSSTGVNVYQELFKEANKAISKRILGHADAMDSVPGKLGSETSVEEALENTKNNDMAFLTHVVNTLLIPKMVQVGFKKIAPLTFRFNNNEEIEEAKIKKLESQDKLSNVVKILSDSGYTVEEKWLNENLDIPITKKELPTLPPTIQNKVDRLYK